MKNPILDYVEKKHFSEKVVPDYRAGDTVKVYTKIREGNKERIQAYEGIVIKRKRGSAVASLTVRKMVGGIGVEKTFPVNSPLVDKIELIKYGTVRRSRLFYLRERLGSKASRVKDNMEKNLKAALEKKETRKALQAAKAQESTKEKVKEDAPKQTEANAETPTKDSEDAKA